MPIYSAFECSTELGAVGSQLAVLRVRHWFQNCWLVIVAVSICQQKYMSQNYLGLQCIWMFNSIRYGGVSNGSPVRKALVPELLFGNNSCKYMSAASQNYLGLGMQGRTTGPILYHFAVATGSEGKEEPVGRNLKNVYLKCLPFPKRHCLSVSSSQEAICRWELAQKHKGCDAS